MRPPSSNIGALPGYLKAINRLASTTMTIQSGQDALDFAAAGLADIRPARAVAIWIRGRESSALEARAVVGTDAWPKVAPLDPETLSEARPLPMGGLDAGWSDGGAIGALVVAPIRVGAATRGLVVIGLPGRSDPRLLVGDETFATGVGLVLHNRDARARFGVLRANADRARRRLYQALDQAPLLVCITRGPSHRFEFVNETFARTMRPFLRPEVGPDGASLAGLAFEDAFAEGRGQRERGLLDRAYGSAAVVIVRSMQVRPVSGDVAGARYYDATFQPLPGDDSVEAGVIFHGVEVTQQVKAQEAAAAMSRRFEDLVRDVKAVFRELDAQSFETLYVSGAAEEVLGYPTAHWHRPGFWRRLIHPDDRESTLAACRARLEEHDEVELDYRVRTAEGVTLPIRDRLRVIRGADGRPRFLRGMMIDNRQRADMEARLLQVQKLESLGVLAGGIAHDFNNLLTGILGNASTLARQVGDSSVPCTHHAAKVRAIVTGAERAADLTRQLLAYSGGGAFESRPVDVSALLRDIDKLLGATLPKKVRMDVQLADDLPAVEGDPTQLQQVFMNLVLNGAEAIGGQKGTVTVATRRQELGIGHTDHLGGRIASGTYIAVTIRDTGSGMDPETIPRIFDPFFTTKVTGRGLGLAAVLGIIRAHGAALDIQTAPGQGTTFTVLFPASTRAAEVWAEPAMQAVPGDGCVLVIDDEEDVRFALRHMLSHLGYDTLEADDGRAGLAAFHKHREQLTAIILDLTMPLMHGDEVFRAIRALDAEVPIILSSGYDESEATRRFSPDSLAGFLHKPFSIEALAATLAGQRAKSS